MDDVDQTSVAKQIKSPTEGKRLIVKGATSVQKTDENFQTESMMCKYVLVMDNTMKNIGHQGQGGHRWNIFFFFDFAKDNTKYVQH